MMRWKELLEKKPHAWVKWGVIAACLCIVIAGFFVIRQRAAALPVEQVENPVFVSREEEPEMQRDDLKNMLVNNIVVWGTVPTFASGPGIRSGISPRCASPWTR